VCNNFQHGSFQPNSAAYLFLFPGRNMAMMLVFLTHFSTDCQETLPPVPRATFIFEMATKSPWERINTQDPSFLSFLFFLCCYRLHAIVSSECRLDTFQNI